MSYIDKIKERAKLDKKTIVLPESKDKRTLLAAARIVEENIANIIMIGNKEKIMDGAGWKLTLPASLSWTRRKLLRWINM